jgi:hypothetical protein
VCVCVCVRARARAPCLTMRQNTLSQLQDSQESFEGGVHRVTASIHFWGWEEEQEENSWAGGDKGQARSSLPDPFLPLSLTPRPQHPNAGVLAVSLKPLHTVPARSSPTQLRV